jgi:hypothetical protein
MYVQAGFEGAVLKGHFESTVGRARSVSTSATRMYGGIVLNSSVGGVKVDVVDDAVRLGAKIIWMPTIDSWYHSEVGLSIPGKRTARRLAIPPIDWAMEGEALAILSLASEAGIVIATGHLSPPECSWLVTHATSPVLLTHPLYRAPGMSAGDVESLCSEGAVAEITAFQLLHGASPGALAALARKLGPESCVLTSDGGQPGSPSPPELLRLLVDSLIAGGLDEDHAREMTTTTPRRLIGDL